MIAVLDACVLSPAALRDLLMWLATAKAYEPRWTEEIHAEWIRSLLADRPDISAAQLERTRRLMDKISPRCLVNNWEHHLSSLTLPDENDRHVLATAIQSNASVIVTFNLSDFPKQTLAIYNIRAVPPDDFLEQVFQDNQPRFLQGIRKHRASLQNPPKTVEEYLATIKRQGLTKCLSLLEANREQI